MIDIPTIIHALSTVASTVERVLERKKAREEADRTRESEATAKRLQELEESDLEQAGLIRELSKNVEELAKAMESEIEKNRRRDQKLQLLIYIGIGLSLTALALAARALLR